MKKLLLGTSALIGATALVASAQAAAPELTISGSLDFHLVGGEDQARNGGGGSDVGPDDTGWDFRQAGSRSEIHFRATGESDGGTAYGAVVDFRYLDHGTRDRVSGIDEAYIFVGGDWGRVHLGQDDGAINHRRLYAGSIAPAPFGIDGVVTHIGSPEAFGSSDANKITYFSPDFNGFEFAASIYESVGEIEADGGAATANDQDILAYSEILELAASFKGDTGDFNYGISASFQQGNSSDLLDGNAAGTRYEDLGFWTVGFTLGFGDISIAGSYSDAGDSGALIAAPANTVAEAPLLTGQTADGRQYYDIGLAYNIGGGMAVGISYGEETFTTFALDDNDATHIAQETVNELIAIDFGFPIMEGMVGYAGVAFSETERPAASVTTGATTGRNTSGVAGVADAAASTTFTASSEPSIDATTYVIGTTVSF